jgi:hypothetical protein
MGGDTSRKRHLNILGLDQFMKEVLGLLGIPLLLGNAGAKKTDGGILRLLT